MTGNGGTGNGTNGGTGNAPSTVVPAQPQTNGYSPSGDKKGGKHEKRERKPLTCYGCGEIGHIRPNCPNKVRRVKSPEGDQQEEVDGWLVGVAVTDLRVDTGSDKTVVRADCVPDSAYLSKTVILDS